MCVSRRLRGVRSRSGRGRPRKPPPESVTPDTCSSQPSQAMGREQVGGQLRRGHWDVGLSKRLNETVIWVAEGNSGDAFRQYTRHTSAANGQVRMTISFRCQGCQAIYRKRKQGKIATITLTDASILRGPLAPHLDGCRTFPEAALVPSQMDKLCRRNVRTGFLQPRQSWNEGRRQLSLLSGKEKTNGTARGSRSLATNFVGWFSCKRQYNRHRSLLFPCIRAPFALPPIYQTTRRLGERWFLPTPNSLGLLVFATDEMLEVAAKSEVLVADGTFKTCPKGFFQFYTIHAQPTKFMLTENNARFKYCEGKAVVNIDVSVARRRR